MGKFDCLPIPLISSQLMNNLLNTTIARPRTCKSCRLMRMNKFILILVFIIALTGCGGGSDSSSGSGGNQPATELERLIVVIGDSIGLGFGASFAFPDMIRSLTDIPVVNISQGGTSAEFGVGRAPGLIEQYKPMYLVVLLGTNNAGGAGGGVPGAINSMRYVVDVANEAGLAAIRLAPRVAVDHPEAAKSALQSVLQSSVEQAVRDKASLAIATLGKPNIALVATASSPRREGAKHGPTMAVDGDPETWWDEVDRQKLYQIRLDFKQPRQVAVISLTGYSHQHFAARDFDVLCDGKVIKEVRNAVYDNNKLIVTLPATKCKSLELKITDYYGKSPAIRELEVYSGVRGQSAAGGSARGGESGVSREWSGVRGREITP